MRACASASPSWGRASAWCARCWRACRTASSQRAAADVPARESAWSRASAAISALAAARDGGLIRGAFPRDPSWLQWPLLEAAIEGNIVADFPLCNKSFNCSYSGVDL